MKKLAGAALSIFIALTLILIAPPSSSAGGRSHGYAGGKKGGGHSNYRGGYGYRGNRGGHHGYRGGYGYSGNRGGHHGYRGGYGYRGNHGYKRVHGRWGYYRRPWGPRWGVNFSWGGPLWWGPGFAPYGFFAPPPVVVQQQPPVIVQPEPQQIDYWYYCQNPQGYFPYIRSCPGGWMRVVPETTPPNP